MENDRNIVDRPKLLGDLVAKAQRLAQLREQHIAPLTGFVEELRLEAGSGAAIPNFDPWDAGVAAEILFLLEAPGARAVASSFVSRNNPDETAKNMFELNRDACIPRIKSLLWNAVPWYIGDGARIRAATAKDLEAGLAPLPRLIQMLPKLRAVVFMGRKAEKARPQVARLRPDLALFSCPHPSPLFVNNRPGNREIILNVFREAAQFLDEASRVAAKSLDTDSSV
ncbi:MULTISPECIES: uracil-DNA glycosylase [unclassified Caballeronia]|uniref:uracil-DNA glycosylase n=1 Tax=unclassified Caballeronia TaxID=2646786 RepID=UPI0028576FC8|nr:MULTISPECIES: uracil-DNA glycosylase [unclassified Caballeronia]MDR5750210.1 uracil-DNA glycosylase [Caballeronia sp. LZ024]MDR5842661.1 uracil-DNA glycosylase [Caballeronia sp. LZ031]